MKEIAIYVEGGGSTAQFQTELRKGFDQLLHEQKQAVRQKNLRWRLVPCGGREQTYVAFINRVRVAAPECLVVLLVDSEEEVASERAKPSVESAEARKQREFEDAQVRKNHLTSRDHWSLRNVNPSSIHLMVRCMEAWLVADADALAKYYGKGFDAKKLPARKNLEAEPKPRLLGKLEKATMHTTKGAYAKVRHASQLLALVDGGKVASRCPRFATFVGWLDDQIRSS